MSKTVTEIDLHALCVLKRAMQTVEGTTGGEEAEALETLHSGDIATTKIDRLCGRIAELEKEVKWAEMTRL